MIKKGFHFSANNLQVYINCERKFELCYLMDQQYPALITEPALKFEQEIKFGHHFHAAVNQHLTGTPEEIVSESLSDSDLRECFEAFIKFKKSLEISKFHTEYSLLSHIDSFPLIAKIDFLAVLKDGTWLIIDWKTTRNEPSSRMYENRMQTILYPFITVDTIPIDLHEDRPSSEVIFCYWFPRFPQKEIEFNYSQKIHNSNRNLIRKLIQEIATKKTGEFKKTENQKRCAYCEFRTLCERGTTPGKFSDADAELDLDALIESLNLDTLEEFQY